MEELEKGQGRLATRSELDVKHIPNLGLEVAAPGRERNGSQTTFAGTPQPAGSPSHQAPGSYQETNLAHLSADS